MAGLSALLAAGSGSGGIFSPCRPGRRPRGFIRRLERVGRECNRSQLCHRGHVRGESPADDGPGALRQRPPSRAPRSEQHHGFYEATGTCESQPFFSCLDCGSDQFIWYTGTLWLIGNAGCGGTGGGIYIGRTRAKTSRPAAAGIGRNTTGVGSENSAITVECYAAAGCQQVPGTTAKYRCFDCAAPSALDRVGDGHCDAENNVDPCYDGGDCCETTCVDGTSTCGNYDRADPDAPPLPDPYYADAAWYLEAIRAPEAWAAGYNGSRRADSHQR